ncbi:MAG TPA: hypothetical protein VLD65_08570 [Anaerolineales bacterium]|nr:hypothetical protein [Anaerolineales bacterium]
MTVAGELDEVPGMCEVQSAAKNHATCHPSKATRRTPLRMLQKMSS